MNDESRPKAAHETSAKTSKPILAHPGDFGAFRRHVPKMFENVDPGLYQRNQSNDLRCRSCGCWHNAVTARCCCGSLR
jgi:hypothetical protein